MCVVCKACSRMHVLVILYSLCIACQCILVYKYTSYVSSLYMPHVYPLHVCKACVYHVETCISINHVHVYSLCSSYAPVYPVQP